MISVMEGMPPGGLVDTGPMSRLAAVNGAAPGVAVGLGALVACPEGDKLQEEDGQGRHLS